MCDYSDLMTKLDEDDVSTLYKMENDLFDTVVLIYNEDTPQEECYVLTDMQGAHPKTMDEVGDYDWVRAEDVNW